MCIYVITIIKGNQEIEYQRSVGYYLEQSHAIDTVMNNIGDIYEWGAYNYALIEKIEPGLYQYDVEPLWFSVEPVRKEKGIDYNIKTVDAPDFAKNTVGFALG